MDFMFTRRKKWKFIADDGNVYCLKRAVNSLFYIKYILNLGLDIWAAPDH